MSRKFKLQLFLNQQLIFWVVLVGALPSSAAQVGDQTRIQDSYLTFPRGENYTSSLGADADLQSAKCFNLQSVRSLFDRLDQSSKKTRTTGASWFRAEYDFDSRGFNVLHFMGSSPLPYGFDIWGFIDIEGTDFAGASREDLSRYFLEVDVKKKLWKGGGIIGEYNDLQGGGNSIGRVGFFHKPEFELLSLEYGVLAGDGFVSFKVFPYETDGRGAQASLAWNKNFDKIMGGRFSAGGFVDVNFNAGVSGDKTVVVTEHQLRVRLMEGLHIITEFRLNEFLQDDFGIAPGIQYRF